MRVTSALWIFVVAISICPSGYLLSQAPGAAGEAVRIADARKQNAAMMRQYTWNSRTELIKGGTVKDVRVDLVTYGPGGQLQRTPMNNQGASLPRGLLRHAVAENERKQMEQYLTGLRDLLDQYTLPTAGKVLDFISSATIQPAEGGSLSQMTGHSVVVPGDTLTIWVDPATRQTRKVQIQSTFQGDAVTATATFKTLPSGLTHVQFGEVEVPEKSLGVQIHNFDYEKNN
jgi:hypothetical protein